MHPHQHHRRPQASGWWALADNGVCVQLHNDDEPVFRIVHKTNERTQKVPQIKVNNSRAIAITSNQGLLQNKIQRKGQLH